MDAYTQHLLGMAVEACDRRLVIDHNPGENTVEWVVVTNGTPARYGPVLADALAALLRDLGVEVPERPTAGEPSRCPGCGSFLPEGYQGIWCVPCWDAEDDRVARDIEAGWV